MYLVFYSRYIFKQMFFFNPIYICLDINTMLYNYLIISTKKRLKYENEFDKIINFFKRDNYILYTRIYNSIII